MLKAVVLPAPFGPSSPTISPAATVMETPLTTRRWRYSLTSFSVRNKAPSTAAATALVGGAFAGWGLFCVSLMSRRLRLSGKFFRRFGPQLDLVRRGGGERV